MSTPQVIERSEQPYVSVRQEVTMDGIPEIAHGIPHVLGWLAGHGIAPAGAPFLKYDVFYRSGRLLMEAGVPVAAAASVVARTRAAADDVDVDVDVDGAGGVQVSVLPAGRFAAVTHHGPPSGLLEVTAGLLDWGAEQGVTWDLTDTGDGEHWGLRMELYRSDPAVVEPDRWHTDVVIRLAD